MLLNKKTHPRLYNSWRGMKERCNNLNNKAYKWYGGKGIKVTKEWDTFKPFAVWALANGYEEGLTIEREKVLEDYNVDNCSWITAKENTINGNSGRYRKTYEAAYEYWVINNCSGTLLASKFNKSVSVTCGWVRGWKANNNQIVETGKVTAAR